MTTAIVKLPHKQEREILTTERSPRRAIGMPRAKKWQPVVSHCGAIPIPAPQKDTIVPSHYRHPTLFVVVRLRDCQQENAILLHSFKAGSNDCL